MQHITGTHFSAILHGQVEIYIGLGGLQIANEQSIFFVEQGILESLGDDRTLMAISHIPRPAEVR